MGQRTTAVIGVSGFVGAQVAAELLRQGHRVVGTLRAPDGEHAGWIEEALSPLGPLELRAAELADRQSLVDATAGCDGIAMCAGVETQAPETVALMVGAAEHTLDAAEANGIDRVALLSSTGSTNPPEGEPDIKHEDTAWSDPDQQEAAGKFSPAAKTRMERAALARMEQSGGALRVGILNPSMIVGPALQAKPPAYLSFMAALLAGERMADAIPNSSMSVIDVRDLAKMHVAILDRPDARGRYFAVVRSWPWRELLAALSRAHPAYTPPPWSDDVTPARPTTFDLGRRDSLGVSLRDLDAMMEGVVAELARRGMLPAAPAC